jgi:hypothetical protein
LKGSAITRAFVSTFAILSTLWTIFGLAAGMFARLHAGRHCYAVTVFLDSFLGLDTADAPVRSSTSDSCTEMGRDPEKMGGMESMIEIQFED